MSSEDLIKRKNKVLENHAKTIEYLDKGYKEAERVQNILKNTKPILDDLDKKFAEKTGLTSTDITLLFFAVGLQVARQYILSNDKFYISSSDGDILVKKSLSFTPPDWQDVLLRSVPYDAIRTGEHVNDTMLSGTTHRFRTLGHDPIFGWIFGTANIMTNSLTKSNLETYQVNMNTMTIVRHYPYGVAGMVGNAVELGLNDNKLLAAAVARQAIHYGSDYFTKHSLPVPVISMINDEFAKNLVCKYGVNMHTITRSAALALLINSIISFIHNLFFDGHDENDKKLYEVRTRKILSYSNLIATASNIIFVGITKDFSKLDIGGAAVTIYRLITDRKAIRQIKEEFIFGNYKSMVMGDGDYLYND